jgi:hypothetical protein
VTSLYDPSFDPLNQRKTECPSCHSALKAVPGAKTKCPHCHGAIFVLIGAKPRPQFLDIESVIASEAVDACARLQVVRV